MSKPLHIGIDPGVHTGYAVWHPGDKRVVRMETLDFWSVVEELYRLTASLVPIIVHIEDPNGNKPVFFKKGADSAAIGRKIGQNVGSNKREASLLIELCKREGWPCTTHVPRKGKVKQEQFAKLTGITERTSQHVRDAVMLIYGR